MSSDILAEDDLCAIADAWHKRGLIKWLDDNRIPYVFAGRCIYHPETQYPCGFQQDWGCSVLLNYHNAYRPEGRITPEPGTPRLEAERTT